MSTTNLSSQEASFRAKEFVPNATELIQLAKEGYSFQTRHVLQTIVSGEQQRLREEQTMWRLGGAVLGACLGLSDGFQLTDAFVGLAFSGIASLSHEAMSHEDRIFLEQCQSLWLIGNNSPVELAQRLGSAKSRILMYEKDWSSPMIFNHHQGIRGDFLVPLGLAGDLAKGFSSLKSREVLERHINFSDIEILQNQFYPSTNETFGIKEIIEITNEEAKRFSPYANSFLRETEPVIISNRNNSAIAYRVPVPTHSDF